MMQVGESSKSRMQSCEDEGSDQWIQVMKSMYKCLSVEPSVNAWMLTAIR